MPELPEVEITATKLQKSGLVGRKIISFRLFSPAQFISGFSLSKAKKDILGKKITVIFRKGKTVFMTLSGNPKRALAFHLKMTGNLYSGKAGERLDKSVRFAVGFAGGAELRFSDVRKFGRIWYGLEKEVLCEKYFAALGRDILKVAFTEFNEKLRGRRGMIKPILLRQDIFSGIGNIIADESLWLSKIHPKTKSHDLDGRRNRVLFGNLKKIINKILKSGGTSMRDWKHPDNEMGGYQNKFLIYDQKICPRCRRRTEKIKVGGRGSTICPGCQKN
ncbi:MAG: hypothetical protein HYY55_00825 [Candidatus Niyogibacteria bacterium]|nr:MAG: hypothetical protein HYY55_00825 [Candidatus Niyogibacteria bacterium]